LSKGGGGVFQHRPPTPGYTTAAHYTGFYVSSSKLTIVV